MKIEKSYLAFHIKLDWESTNMIVPVQIVFFFFFVTALFRATNFFQKESHLLFYQLIKVYSYEPHPFLLGLFFACLPIIN
jgi:hypothetical protein